MFASLRYNLLLKEILQNGPFLLLKKPFNVTHLIHCNNRHSQYILYTLRSFCLWSMDAFISVVIFLYAKHVKIKIQNILMQTSINDKIVGKQNYQGIKNYATTKINSSIKHFQSMFMEVHIAGSYCNINPGPPYILSRT